MNLEEFPTTEERTSDQNELPKLRTFTIKDFIVDKIIKENFNNKKRNSNHEDHETVPSTENIGNNISPPTEDVDIEFKNIGEIYGRDKIQNKETKTEEEKNVEQYKLEMEHNGILQEIPEAIDIKEIEKSVMLKKKTESIWNLYAENGDDEVNMKGNENFQLQEREYDRKYRESIEEWPFPVPIVLPIAPLNFHFDDAEYPLNEELELSPLIELRKDSVSFENTPESFIMESDLSPNGASED